MCIVNLFDIKRQTKRGRIAIQYTIIKIEFNYDMNMCSTFSILVNSLKLMYEYETMKWKKYV